MMHIVNRDDHRTDDMNIGRRKNGSFFGQFGGSKVIALCVTVVLILSGVSGMPLPAKASQIAENQTVVVNGRSFVVRAMNDEYANNAYLSLRDLAVALQGTDKEYQIRFAKADGEDMVELSYGSYESVGGENTEYDEESMEKTGWLLKNSCKRTHMQIDGQDYYFFGIRSQNAEEHEDFFMSSGELALILNMEVYYENGDLIINPDRPCILDVQKMDEDGFFYMTDSCLVGDATTGEIYYALEADKVVSIASTTKLMTYFVVMDGVANGEITLQDMVTFSENAEKESKTSNGVIPLTAGSSAPIPEVMEAMLIKSSNECALALAEHLCGSEEAFVERMNAKAKQLGLSDNTHFYNPHGLPFYEKDRILSAKTQNRMTANDMFMLVSELLSVYPQITEITSIKTTHLETLKTEIKNTNTLLYNVPEAVGLKTGTTTKAGSCLVAASRVYDEDENEHYIVSIEYGAESAQIQSYTSLMLMRYGLQEFRGTKPEPEQKPIPENAEDLMRTLLSTAKRS